MKITQFATSEQKETEGTWVEVGEGASLLIARTGNPEYRKLLRRLMKPYEKQLRLDTMPAGKLDDLFAQVIARTILLDWKGLKDENGKAVEYSTDQAYTYLADKRYKEFRALVVSIADDAESFREETIAADADALGNGSGGGSSGAPSSNRSPKSKAD